MTPEEEELFYQANMPLTEEQKLFRDYKQSIYGLGPVPFLVNMGERADGSPSEVPKEEERREEG